MKNLWFFATVYAVGILFFGMHVPAKESVINRYVADEFRATTYSISSMIEILCNSFACFLLSASIRPEIMNTLWIVIGVCLLIAAGIWAMLLHAVGSLATTRTIW